MCKKGWSKKAVFLTSITILYRLLNLKSKDIAYVKGSSQNKRITIIYDFSVFRARDN